MKNQFAVILSMVKQTSQRTENVQQFESRIRERIMALARSHDLLVSEDWRGATIDDLLKAQTELLSQRHRIAASGPSVLLSPMAVQYLGMAFHELGANAAMYGALSDYEGQIDVTWSIADEGRRIVARTDMERTRRARPSGHLERRLRKCRIGADRTGGAWWNRPSDKTGQRIDVEIARGRCGTWKLRR
ncbi:sensor histidine kinase (plasmid) [Mesorhizobium sp. AR02]|uniref:sensor histidine kinase n=1 Tax=Mesorhizobium sp. AR02 TaxID=2865837 RepID=UPI00215E2EAC|nr:sensor histidine kinase [Mesorhizobium sp. AR02]UVK57320.1 sensor histidine kinase [Mesorhizobium sp. AR02]